MLRLLLILASSAWSQPVPYSLQKLDKPTDVGGINQNFRSVTDYVNRVDMTNGGTINGDLSVNNINMAIGSSITVPSLSITTSASASVPGLYLDTNNNAYTSFGSSLALIPGRFFHDDYTLAATTAAATALEISFTTVTIQANSVKNGMCVYIEFAGWQVGSFTPTRRLRINGQGGLVAYNLSSNMLSSGLEASTRICRVGAGNSAIVSNRTSRQGGVTALNVTCGSCTVNGDQLAIDWTQNNTISYTSQIITTGLGTDDFTYMRAWIDK